MSYTYLQEQGGILGGYFLAIEPFVRWTYEKMLYYQERIGKAFKIVRKEAAL